jgi:hypothetical protein
LRQVAESLCFKSRYEPLAKLRGRRALAVKEAWRLKKLEDFPETIRRHDGRLHEVKSAEFSPRFYQALLRFLRVFFPCSMR